MKFGKCAIHGEKTFESSKGDRMICHGKGTDHQQQVRRAFQLGELRMEIWLRRYDHKRASRILSRIDRVMRQIDDKAGGWR